MNSEENGFICSKQHELLKRITPIGFTGTVKILRLWYVLNAKTICRILIKVFFLGNLLKNQSCSDSTISFHYMIPEAMAKMYELWLKYKNKNDLGFNLSTITDKIDF